MVSLLFSSTKESVVSKSMLSKLLFSLLGLTTLVGLALPSLAQTPTSKITVEISRFRNQQGQACLSLYSSSRGFPGNARAAVESRCVAITSTPLVVTFEDLEPGRYAVVVLHDANSDRAPNLNALGIPVEGFGFSRNPALRAGPPSFNSSAFDVAGDNTNVSIQLRYLFRS